MEGTKYLQPGLDADGRLRAAGTLKKGLTIGAEKCRDFELREPMAGDCLAAETECPMTRPLGYETAVIARSLVRLGSFTGPFTTGMLAKLHTTDLNALRRALAEVEAEGELQPSASENG